MPGPSPALRQLPVALDALEPNYLKIVSNFGMHQRGPKSAEIPPKITSQ
jgi:hypothetical protein